MNISRIASSIFLISFIFISINSEFLFIILIINFLSFLCYWEFFRLLNFKNLQNIQKVRVNNFFLTRSKITFIDCFQIILLEIVLTLYTFEKLFLAFLIFLIVLFLNVFKPNYKILNFFGIIYLTIPFISAYDFYCYQTSLLLLVILIAVATDTGGYFFGKNFKGPKIFPLISPNKTWAGFIGGILLTVLVFYFFAVFNSKTNYIIILMIIFFSITCQLGDFIESYFKRFCSVKDSSNLIPGHGGVLDRIDGIIFLLILFFILNLLNFNLFENLKIF